MSARTLEFLASFYTEDKVVPTTITQNELNLAARELGIPDFDGSFGDLYMSGAEIFEDQDVYVGDEGVMAPFVALGSEQWVRRMFARGARDFDKSISVAVQYRQHNMVNLLISLGAKNFDKALESAIEFDDDVMINFFLGLTKKFRLGLNRAARKGKYDLVVLLSTKPGVNINQAMIEAGRDGHIDVVRYLLSIGARSFNSTLDIAAYNTHFDIVVLMVEQGANNINDVIDVILMLGYYDMFEYLFATGKATCYNRIMVMAAVRGRIDIIDRMVALGAKNFAEAIENAEVTKQDETVAYLKTLM